MALRPRFSPGYGDLPLELQTNLFKVLDCQHFIGLTLNDSMLMSPSKSVTAIVGLREREMI
jgi:cobalamin-dependent methionine synthase I